MELLLAGEVNFVRYKGPHTKRYMERRADTDCLCWKIHQKGICVFESFRLCFSNFYFLIRKAFWAMGSLSEVLLFPLMHGGNKAAGFFKYIGP